MFVDYCGTKVPKRRVVPYVKYGAAVQEYCTAVGLLPYLHTPAGVIHTYDKVRLRDVVALKYRGASHVERGEHRRKAFLLCPVHIAHAPT